MTAETNPGDYVSIGWKVFPCHHIVHGACTCGKADCSSPGKHPRTRNGVKDATDNLDVLRGWWEAYPGCNWALATGKESGVFVIDVDDRKDGYASFDEFEQMRREPLPKSLTASTGGGGKHFFFSYPSDGSKIGNRVNWLQGVDIRADGGYVILPPGNHISGGFYSWENWGHHIVDAPFDLVASVSAGGPASPGATKLGSTDELLRGLAEGSRDDQIFRMACRLRRKLGDGSVEAVTALVLIAARNSTPPFPEAEALAKVRQAFLQDHSDEEDIFSGGSDELDGDEADPIARLTDMGNRDRFVRTHGDDFRYVVGIGWHRWTDTGWSAVSEGVVTHAGTSIPDVIRQDATRVLDTTLKSRVIRWAHDSESRGRISAMVDLASTHPAIARDPSDFDNVKHELACRNGMVDLRTGLLRPFTRDDLFTRNTHIIYEPQAFLPQWDSMLKTATNGDEELERYLQMAAGYTLTGSVAEECFFIISGPTASGKSTFMEGLSTAFGRYADISAADTFMKKFGGKDNRDEVVKFAGARLISTEELPEGERFDDAFIKRITGGSALSARHLYQEAFSFMPQFKLWMATNHDPVTSDSAMFRRIKRVPFPRTIPKEQRDPTLKELLKDPEIGGPAVLAWAVQGAVMYYQTGHLIEPMSVKNSTTSYEMMQDSFTHFLNETYRTVPDELAEVRFTEVYAQYSAWCKNANERPAKRPQFEQKLMDRHHTISVKDNGDKFITGIELRADVFNPLQMPFT